MKGNLLRFQTNLTVGYTDGTSELFEDVHPDQSFAFRDNCLTFETTSGDKIYYIPENKIRSYYTECVETK